MVCSSESAHKLPARSKFVLAQVSRAIAGSKLASGKPLQAPKKAKMGRLAQWTHTHQDKMGRVDVGEELAV